MCFSAAQSRDPNASVLRRFLERTRRTRSSGRVCPDCSSRWCWVWFCRSLAWERWRPCSSSSCSPASISSVELQCMNWSPSWARPQPSISQHSSTVSSHRTECYQQQKDFQQQVALKTRVCSSPKSHFKVGVVVVFPFMHLFTWSVFELHGENTIGYF